MISLAWLPRIAGKAKGAAPAPPPPEPTPNMVEDFDGANLQSEDGTDWIVDEDD